MNVILLEAMVSLFERSLSGASRRKRQTALALAALSVGGMVLARTLPNSEVAEAVRAAALKHGRTMLST